MDVDLWPSAATRQYVKELQAKGADGERLLRMLTGNHPAQRVDFKLLVDLTKDLAVETARAKARHVDHVYLSRRYRAIAKLKLQDDPLLRDLSRRALAADLHAIGKALSRLVTDPDHHRMPAVGIRVKPGGKHKCDLLAHQAFWTRPMAAFVLYLHPILGS